MKPSLTWLAVLNALWSAAGRVRPPLGWSQNYGWRWVETRDPRIGIAASIEVRVRSLTLDWSGDMPEAVRAELFLRALCAMEWVLTFHEKTQPPIETELHDFLAWSMNTMWNEEGLAWAKRRLLPVCWMPDLPADPMKN